MIDLTAAAAAFERALFERGVVAGRTRSDTFVEALCAAHRIDARDLYWLARITLLPSIADLPRFDEAFVAFWTSAEVADRPAEERAQTPLAERESPQTLPSLTRSETADGPRHLASASSEERLRECDFALLDDRYRARGAAHGGRSRPASVRAAPCKAAPTGLLVRRLGLDGALCASAPALRPPHRAGSPQGPRLRVCDPAHRSLADVARARRRQSARAGRAPPAGLRGRNAHRRRAARVQHPVRATGCNPRRNGRDPL